MYSAHGVGAGADLPIPVSLALAGGAAALVVSFAVLVMAWRSPRYDAADRVGRPAPRWLTRAVDAPAYVLTLRLLGLAVLGFAVWCVAAGEDDVATNPVFGLVYVLLWVGLVPLSLLLGPAVKALSPARALHALLAAALRVDRREGWVRLPAAVGYWPAAAGLAAFVWLELVSPDGVRLATVATWFAAYLIITVVGGLVFGTRWMESADPFEVYSTLVAHLSVWSRDDQGRLQLVSPLRNLSRAPVRPGLVAVVSLLLGSTAFDSIGSSTWWVRLQQETRLDTTWLGTAVLAGMCLVVAVTLVIATGGPRPADTVARSSVPGRLAPSIVPIVVGYVIAHYLTLLVETGQLTLILASDPLNQGMDLFGTAERDVDLWLSLHPGFTASVKVAAIVLGHVVAVVAAHDRVLTLVPKERAGAAQLPLLMVMVAYTVTGLTLLLGV